MKKPVVDNNKCIGCGMCEGICPDVFRVNEEGKIEVLETAYAQVDQEIMEAAKACPVMAINY